MWRSYGKNMEVAIIFNEKFVKDLMDLQKKYMQPDGAPLLLVF